MSRYIIAYADLFNGLITQTVVEAENKVQAYKEFFKDINFSECESYEKFEDLIFNCDGMCSILEIK